MNRRISALLLSLVMILCTSVIPASAETATDNYYSIFNLEEVNVGAKVPSGTVALPNGMSLAGISEFSSGWQAGYAFDGSQEIIEKDGKKAWKINFDTPMSYYNNLCDVQNEFMIKIEIPPTAIPYVTGVKADITNNSAAALGISFGFTDGNSVSWLNGYSNSFEKDYNETGEITLVRNISDLWKRSELYATCPTLSEKWEVGAANSVYFVIVSKGCSGEEGGYVVINDISVNLSIPVNQLLGEKDISLLNFDYAVSGAVSKGENALPPDVYGVSRWTPSGCGISNMYSGEQEIVEVNDNKAWKINFNKSAAQNGWLWGSYGLYGFTVNIPKNYGHYIVKINIEVENYTTGNLAYRFGVTDGVHMGTTSSDGYYGLSAKGTQKISLKLSELGTYSNAYVATHGGISSGKWNDSGYDTDKFYILLNDTAASEGGTGYIIIKDITITVSTGQIKWNTASVTGGTVENGKIKIPVSTSEQTVAIKVPKGMLIQADTLTYQLTSTSNTSVSLKFYSKTVTDSGAEGYIKKGENAWMYSIDAGSSGYANTMDFYAPDGGSNCVRIFEGAWYLDNWMGNTSNHPSATEKGNIVTICLGISGVTNPSGYIIIDAITYTEAGVKLKANTASSGTVTISTSMVKVGEVGKFIVTPKKGYYLKDLSVKSSLGEKLDYEMVSGYNNVGIRYQVIAPAADIIVTPTFAAISNSMPYWAYYREDKWVAEFSLPLKDGLAYNETKRKFETASDYGAFIAGTEALEKYGYTVEDLTPEFVDELFETGHHLSNYIFKMDSANMKKAATTKYAVKFIAEIEDVTIDLRRTPIAFVTFTEFVDSSGAVTNSVCTYNLKSLDALTYGSKFVENFTAKKGINFAASLKSDRSVWTDIKSKGFDHIRLPLSLNDALNENGCINEEAFIDADNAIDNALKAGFSVVIDGHGLPVNLCGNYAASVDTYYSLWKQVAKRYAHLPLSVAFEFINEPNTQISYSSSDPDPITGTELMTVMNNSIKNTRAIKGNEDRYLVLSNNFNAAWALNQYTSNSHVLAYKNIILDIHYYDPMNFSHSGCHWITNADGSMTYPGGATSYSLSDIESTMNTLKNIEATYGVMVWLGEWGAYAPDANAKISYYNDVSSVAEANGLSWCLWEYGGGWSIYGNGVWDQDLLNAILS